MLHVGVVQVKWDVGKGARSREMPCTRCVTSGSHPIVDIPAIRRSHVRIASVNTGSGYDRWTEQVTGVVKCSKW